MSTPVDLNIVMPYGATMVGDGTVRASLATPHPKQHSTTGLKLAAGPCRVSASWAGAQAVELRLYGKGDAFKRVLTTINSGGDGHCRRTRWGLHPARRKNQPTRRNHRHSRGVPAQLRVARRAGAVV